jgi:hypothetical protein
VDAIGRKRHTHARTLFSRRAFEVVVGHLVAPTRVRVAGVDDDGVGVAIGIAATADQDNIGTADAIVGEQTKIRFVEMKPVVRLCVADDAAVSALLGAITGEGLIPELVAPAGGIAVDARPGDGHLPRLRRRQHRIQRMADCRLGDPPGSRAVKHVMVVAQQQREGAHPRAYAQYTT